MPAVFELPGFVNITGFQGAIIELSLFFVSATIIRNAYDIQMGLVPYYWLAFTVLTGMWEMSYVFNKKQVCKMAASLVKNDEHVWKKTYNLRMVLPHNLAKVFYAEYAAHADRLYGSSVFPWKYWSIVIEFTHCACCGLCALLMFLSLYGQFNDKVVDQFLVQSMSFQAMNSILYMSMYFIQTRDCGSVNFITDKFPVKERKFMLINIFWTLMPTIILFGLLFR